MPFMLSFLLVGCIDPRTPWFYTSMALYAVVLVAVAESARACSYYSISTGMQIGDPRLYHFWLCQSI